MSESDVDRVAQIPGRRVGDDNRYNSGEHPENPIVVVVVVVVAVVVVASLELLEGAVK